MDPLERFEYIKSCEPPATLSRVIGPVVQNKKVALRLWYMMYNIVDNCVWLNIALPEGLHPIEVDGKYVMHSNRKRMRIANAKITPLKRMRESNLEDRESQRQRNLLQEQRASLTIKEKRLI